MVEQGKALPSASINDLAAGVINGIVIVVSAMALAAMMFTGPLAPYLPQGIGMLLIGSMVFALCASFGSSYALIMMAPQDIPVAILALIAAGVGASTGTELSPREAFEFMFVSIALTSVLVGLFFWALGRFRLGKLVRFIPYPVVGGFLAGTGWLIVTFSVAMMSGIDFTLAGAADLLSVERALLWSPGLLFALVLMVASRRWRHPLVTPGLLVIGIALFYVVVIAAGVDFETLEMRGLLLGPFPEGGLIPGLPEPLLASFRWNLFVAQLPAITTMMILCAISVLFTYSGLELIVRRDFDLDRELRVTGYANVLAGMVGATPGYVTVSETSMSHRVGARSRLPGLLVTLLCGLVLLFGAELLSIFPRMILGGLLLYFGLDFLLAWLVDTWKKLDRGDYLVIVLILVVIATVGFIQGIVIGLLMSILLFVVNYSRIEIIRYELSGRTFASNVERSNELRQILAERGDQVFILPLQGFIFFGTANRLLQRVSARVGHGGGNPLVYLLFDFRHVSGLDSSAVQSFGKLRLLAEQQGFGMCLCALNGEMTKQLRLENLLPDPRGIIQTFDDLDHGLEYCEEYVIRSALREMDSDTCPASDNAFGNWYADLEEFTTVSHVPADTAIIEQGQDPGGIYFLEDGRITVKIDADSGHQMRLKTLGPGTVVGEVSLYLDGHASATVVTDVDSRIRFLSRQGFADLNQQAPAKAANLHVFIVQLLSERLACSNATIRALMR